MWYPHPWICTLVFVLNIITCRMSSSNYIYLNSFPYFLNILTNNQLKFNRGWCNRASKRQRDLLGCSSHCWCWLLLKLYFPKKVVSKCFYLWANVKGEEPVTPERWKWTFCHLLSRLCHTRVSSDCWVWAWPCLQHKHFHIGSVGKTTQNVILIKNLQSLVTCQTIIMVLLAFFNLEWYLLQFFSELLQDCMSLQNFINFIYSHEYLV